jgi:hypothetical protein
MDGIFHQLHVGKQPRKATPESMRGWWALIIRLINHSDVWDCYYVGVSRRQAKWNGRAGNPNEEAKAECS